MDLWAEIKYETPLSLSPTFPLLLLSLMSQKHSPDCSEKIKNEYDYVIVGGGTAGSVVAARLCEDPCVSVLVLEAGPKPPLISEVPELRKSLRGTDLDWQFQTVPQKHSASALKDKKLTWIQGKMLGGSGSMNNMIYDRGIPKVYDDWAAQGAKGWSYKDVLPYFLKLEDKRDFYSLDDGYNHSRGPITIEKPRFHSSFQRVFKEAAENLGYQFVGLNDDKITGFYDTLFNTRNGQRCSSVKGYLVSAEHRSNLDIFLNATATEVIIKDKKARAVEFYHDGEFQIVRARKEIIVSAGVVNTPKLLMLSGIGPREELEKWNIPVISNIPVGKNLQDHSASNYFFTIDPQFSVLKNLSDPWIIEEYIDYRSGPLSAIDIMGVVFSSGLHRTSETGYPNFLVSIFQGAIKDFDNWANSRLEPEVYRKYFGSIDRNRGFSMCSSQQLHPRSRGSITLKSSDPFDPPMIDPNYLEDPNDVDNTAEGLKLCKKLVNSESFQRLGAKPLDSFMPGCEDYAKSDEDYFRCYARRITLTTFHGVGTAKMGDVDDPNTVVDPELRVKGVKGLRVVDASIMPVIPSCNTNIPTIMIAEKASDIIRKSIKCFKEKKFKSISDFRNNFIQEEEVQALFF